MCDDAARFVVCEIAICTRLPCDVDDIVSLHFVSHFCSRPIDGNASFFDHDIGVASRAILFVSEIRIDSYRIRDWCGRCMVVHTRTITGMTEIVH